MRNKIIIAFIIILLILISVYFIYISFLFFPEDTTIKYHYQLEIIADEDISYNIICPLANNSNLIRNIHIKSGKAEYEIAETKYGKGINITGTGSIKIESIYEREGKPDDRMELTMHNSSSENFYKYGRDYLVNIYCSINSTNSIQLKINCMQEWGDFKQNSDKMAGGGDGWELIKNIEIGWQQATVENIGYDT